MKNKTKKSEPKASRAALLTEHDRIEHQLAKLEQDAKTSDSRSIKAVEKATATYTATANKAQAAFDKAITKAQKTLTAATAKANNTNHDERNAISVARGPLRRRLQFINSEIRREFPADKYVSSNAGVYPVTGTVTGRVITRSIRTASEAVLPEGVWQRGPTWERCRNGNNLLLRRVAAERVGD